MILKEAMEKAEMIKGTRSCRQRKNSCSLNPSMRSSFMRRMMKSRKMKTG
jgi:hypothetical protein